MSIKHVRSKVAYDILAYLVENPEAGDTMEGILEWWLMEQKIKQETETVRKALEALVSKGFVIKSHLGNSRLFYRINLDKHKEILEFLNNSNLFGLDSKEIK